MHAALCGSLLTLLACQAAAQTKEKTTTEAGIFLDLQRINLGTLSSLEEKKNYLMTIQLEKQRIQNHMLRGIYENAYDLYRQGDYERSQELTAKILSIDPSFQDAQMLLQASGQLKGASRGIGERVMLEDRFDEGMNLYKEGKVVEAIRKWEEVLKLSPGNMRASYWLNKAKKELSDEYRRRGDAAYPRRLKEALDNWYNALLYNKNNPELLALVSNAEDEMRDQVASQNLAYGLELYEAGKLVEAYNALKKVLEVQPGDTKAQKLVKEVRGEIAKSYVTQGRKSYGDRRYPDAIESWNKARSWGYSPDFVDQLVARAKEMIKRESEEKRAKADQVRQDAAAAAEAEKRKREEAQADKIRAAMDGATGEKSGTALPAAGAKSGPSEENRRAAQKRYETGLGYLMTGDYERARSEFTAAKQLDPSNPDVDAGLRKIDQLLGQQ